MGKKISRSSFTFVDLCCGIGGNRIAMEQLGGTCVFACDIDPDARSVYAENFGKLDATDLFNVSALPPHDVLCAGPPCYVYSRANRGDCRSGGQARKPSETDLAQSMRLWQHILHLSRTTRYAMLFESTNTLQTARGNQFYQGLKATIMKHAKEVHDQILNAADYGVPQIRKRWYCVAFKQPIKCFTFPKPTHPIPVSIASILDKCPNKTHIRKRNVTYKRKENVYRTTSRCIGFLDGINTQNRRVFSRRYPGPCLTATAAFYVLHDAHERKHNHPQVRMLNIHELCRYMGFPDQYRIPNKRVLSTRLLGKAVVPPIVYAIGKNLLCAKGG